MSINGILKDEVENEDMGDYTAFDYVEVYSYNEVTGSFDLSFRDDFDFFNVERWEKDDNETWSSLTSTHVEENVYFSGGNLLLILDQAEDYSGED